MLAQLLMRVGCMPSRVMMKFLQQSKLSEMRLNSSAGVWISSAGLGTGFSSAGEVMSHFGYGLNGILGWNVRSY